MADHMGTSVVTTVLGMAARHGPTQPGITTCSFRPRITRCISLEFGAYTSQLGDYPIGEPDRLFLAVTRGQNQLNAALKNELVYRIALPLPENEPPQILQTTSNYVTIRNVSTQVWGTEPRTKSRQPGIPARKQHNQKTTPSKKHPAHHGVSL